MEHYDVVILGGGPAGSTAALYLSRYARKVLVVSKDLGSLGSSGGIENWPGTRNIPGVELFGNFQEHAKEYGAEFIFGPIEKVIKQDKNFIITVNNTNYSSSALILSYGTEHRHLNIPGEEKFIGKGVSFCATCDGMFFKNRDVVVIGGADSAAKSALYLSDISRKVTIIYRGVKMRCENVYLERIHKRENIEIIYDSTPIEILGDSELEGIKIKRGNEEETINCDGVFVEIGGSPSREISDSLNIDTSKDGYIKVDSEKKTNIEGVFAAGDVTDIILRQVITASGDGALAAYSAHEYLQKLG